MFSKHHYLDHKHNNAARVYVCYINDNPAGFISILPQPGNKLKDNWRVHRLVVLPEYQGIGIGIRILNDVAKLYKSEGLLLRIVTSAPSLLRALNRDNSGWYCISFGRQKTGTGMARALGKKKNNKISSTNKRMSASFYYKGNINKINNKNYG
jgi:GNAT superfamily N-acetyltransferase